MTRTADIVVVGGGIVGASVAYHVARAGAGRVLLLEAQAATGTGATSASAGGTRKLFSVEVNVRMSVESQEAFAVFEGETGQAIDLRRTGYLLLALMPGELEGYRRDLVLLERTGVKDAALLSPGQAQDLVPQLETNDVLGALYCPSDGHLSPAAVTEGYARRARQLGAVIETGVEVLEVERSGNRVSAVRTTTGRVETRVVVAAAGARAAEVARRAGLTIPVTPRRRLIYVTKHAHGIGDHAPMVFDFQTWFYFRREGQGVLLGTGNTAEPPSYDTAPDWEFLAAISPGIFRRLPCLAHAAIPTAWAGCEGYTPDGSALLGPTAELDGFFLACGFSGHGVMHSPAAGRIVADMILGRAVGYDVSHLDPDRFARGVVRTSEAHVALPPDHELPEA